MTDPNSDPTQKRWGLRWWPRTLRHKAAWAVVLVTLLALGNVVTLQTLLRRSDNVAATLNVAGKMRMWSQRIALEALATEQDPQIEGAWPALDERYRTFEAAHRTLRDGGQVYGLHVAPLDASLRPTLDALGESWLIYRRAIDTLHTSVHNRTDPPPVASVMAASDALLVQTEALMDRLVEFANDVHRSALSSSLSLFMLDVLLLIMGYAVVIQRVLHPIHNLAQQCSQMTQGNYRCRTELPPGDELGELAQALNYSAQHIEMLLQDVAQERAAVAQVQAMFNGLADNSVAGVYMLDEQIRITYANEQLARIFGYEQAELAQYFPLQRLFPAAAYETVERSVRDRLQGRAHSARYERPMLRADGSQIDIEIFGTATSLNGRPAIIGMMIDISERKRAEASMRRAALVYQHTSEAMVITDADGIAQDINPAFTAITGYHTTDIIGRRLNVLSSGRHDEKFYQAMWHSLLETGSWSGDIYNRRKNGEEYIERLNITTSYNPDGSVNCRIGLFADVTERRQREASIWHQAHYDHLTQLPNRQMFQQNLRRAMEQSRHNGMPFALVFLDLDFFKEVNDTFGHDEGDELLRQVSRRLQSCVRGSDQVARLGGDEFTLILHDLKQTSDAFPICRKVLQAIALPYDLHSNTVHISVSVGVTFFPIDGLDGTELLKHADLAMYAAKEKGRNQFCTFDPSMEQAAQSRRLLLRDLQQGLEESEFTLHYQPIVEMKTRRIVKAEALLRWQQPTRGPLSPAEFIPLAEESGLIVELGDWIFREAARQVAQWRHELAPNFALSVNVSPVQLQSNELSAQDWLAYLHELELPGAALVIEITERVLLDASKEVDTKLGALQKAHIQLALDDFGTGYSSLSYLKRFDIDYIKIDRSFVNNLSLGSEDAVLCQAIIAMAHQLEIHVVAEGVETQAQHDFLLSAGCDYGQGYLYCRPIPAPEFTARLQAQAQAQAQAQES